MLTKISTATVFGIDALSVEIEVDCAKGLPRELIVGLPDTVVRESKERIKAAIRNAGFDYPLRVYTINLAPADLKKQGPLFDLPIAVGILHVTGQIERPPDAIIVGELSLNGDVKPVKGIISICEFVQSRSPTQLFLPERNIGEAQTVPGIELFPVKHLSDFKKGVSKFNGKGPAKRVFAPTHNNDVSDIRGQQMAKRAMEISAAGHHNFLMIGPPGSGKTMIAQRLLSLLPPLSTHERIDVMKIQSISKQSGPLPEDISRPFRAPHHTTTYVGMVGGGAYPKPGEITMAHRGILFLDELPEFQRQVIDVLRQPLEERHISISRANYAINFPASFILIAAMNPCPCGYWNDEKKDCTCSFSQIQNYWKKISGPVLDRIDLIVEVPRLKPSDYQTSPQTTQEPLTSSMIKTRVTKALSMRNIRSKNRNQKQTSAHPEIPKAAIKILNTALEKGLLTGRSYQKVLEVARTIADLDEKEEISFEHICESLQFRKSQFLI